MKKILTILTSVMLCMTMLTVLPAQVIASAAENETKAAENAKKYVSEVKVGMGKTADEAAKELLAEGYTILSDGKGYADLNKDAGTGSLLKEGPKEKVVFLGYKTTEDAGEAITDLAVMNMNGGYSFKEYEKLLNDHMDGKIKPFMERFVATLQEYRENLKKPQDSVNYKRADYYKTLLNKLTDDDTGAKPLGDLLVNPTKYEMGDDAYNKLSDAEKKNHCDILTLLMQGNGQAVMLMETALTKASDPGDNTWLDRFKEKDPEALTEELRKENANMTPSEVNAELDKLYYDDAKRILEKWSAFNDTLNGYDDALDKADEVVEAGENSKEIKVAENATEKEVAGAIADGLKAESNMLKGSMAAEDIVVHDYLEATKYGDGTLLEFFERPQSDFSGEESIRQLYPIVDALTAGQLAGLDFLSIKDMILMAVTDGSGYQSFDVKEMKPASIYQDVNRELYEKGGVALTSDTLRQQAADNEKVESFKLSTLGYVLWGCTAASAGVVVASQIIRRALRPEIYKQADAIKESIRHYQKEIAQIKAEKSVDSYLKKINKELISGKEDIIGKEKYNLKALENQDDFKEAAKQYALKSKICNFLSAGFAVVTAVLAGYSIYTTITEMMAYYKVDFVPIPKYIVEKTDITVAVKADGSPATEEDEKNGNATRVFEKNETAYYSAVLCNRTDGSSNVEKKNHEILQDRSDLNGDVGKQWLALYSVKYVNGQPILADSLKVQTGKSDLPEGYSIGIHRFGEKAAFNLTSELFCYNDAPKGTYVFFKCDTDIAKASTAAGSTFAAGTAAIFALIGIIVGSGVTLIIVSVVNKKKKKQANNTEN